VVNCDGLDPNRTSYNSRNLGTASDAADCLSKCAASAGCVVVAFRASNGACFRYSGLSGNCAYSAFKTYSNLYDNRKIYIDTTNAGTFNAIYKVNANGGATQLKTIAITVKSCATAGLVEPSSSDYTSALSTVIMQNTGTKEYTLPVWTTNDSDCPVESYKL